ncbi:MAG: DNA (cytosine-5-)-methyltransferase [Alphaproteobacteria bacterium]|nr:DNA (cytosine-5-)-methyltransferase [Alphaproteobacteria bacterium]
MKKVLSLFSGCGGMDIGFEGNFHVLKECVNAKKHPTWIKAVNNDRVLLADTGFKTIFSNDILKEAAKAWKLYFNSLNDNNIDIYKTDSIVDLVKRHKSGEKIFPENVDIVTGGFPCQDFSLAGKRKGFSSHKNHLGKIDENIPTSENRGCLYMWMREVISITRPKVFFAENVKGLVSLGDAKKIIESDFASIDGDGYFVFPAKILNAGEYGVPQKRERIIFIGLNRSYLKPGVIEKIENNEIDLYPPITHNINNKSTLFDDKDLYPIVTTRIAFKGLKEPHLSSDLAQKAYSKAKFIKKGQGSTEVNLDGLGPTIRAEHHGNIEFRRLNKEHCGKYSEEINLGCIERRLTVRECARIQTFPDEYEFVKEGVLSASSAYKVIGNAVPPLLAYNIAKHISELWDVLFKKD